MNSCILVGTILVPSRADVDNKAEKVDKNDVEDNDCSPLADVQLVRDFKFGARFVYVIF